MAESDERPSLSYAAESSAADQIDRQDTKDASRALIWKNLRDVHRHVAETGQLSGLDSAGSV